MTCVRSRFCFILQNFALNNRIVTRLRYSQKTIFNMAAVRHIGFAVTRGVCPPNALEQVPLPFPPSPSPSLPLHSLPLPSLSLPLEVGPLIAARGVWGSALASPPPGRQTAVGEFQAKKSRL